jgi:hypothetical protein
MIVHVMTIAVYMLVGMFACLMRMLMAVMSMRHGLVLVLMLMFVLVMATHCDSPPYLI